MQGPPGKVKAKAYTIDLCPHIRVLTQRGAVPVLALRRADRLVTRDGLTAILAGQRIHAVSSGYQVRTHGFSAQPLSAQTCVNAAQAVFLRDWRAPLFLNTAQGPLPFARLIDGEWVRRLPQKPRAWTRLYLPKPTVLYANGIELVVPAEELQFAQSAVSLQTA